MNAGSLCTRTVDVARKGDTVQAVANRMHQRNVGSVVVVDEAERPIGIVTDRDLVLRVLTHARDPVATTVGDVMTPNPRRVQTDASVETALRSMQAGTFRRLLVVERDGSLAGVLSLDDVLVAFAGDFDRIRRLLVHEKPDSMALV